MPEGTEHERMDEAVNAVVARMRRLPVVALLDLHHGLDELAKRPQVHPDDVVALITSATRRRR